MAKYRVWAQSISDVYLDVEADSEEEALQIAEDADGGEFIDDPTGGDWIMGSVFEIEDDDEDDDEDDLLDGDLEDQFEMLLEEGDRKDGRKG